MGFRACAGVFGGEVGWSAPGGSACRLHDTVIPEALGEAKVHQLHAPARVTVRWPVTGGARMGGHGADVIHTTSATAGTVTRGGGMA